MPKYFHAENFRVFPWITVRNKAVLDYEKFVHQTFYPFIIHPYSRFRLVWELLVLALFPVNTIIFSLTWAFIPHISLFYQVHVIFIQIINLADLILSFFTGYVESATEIVVLDPKQIARRYLFTFFLLDLFACIPVELVLYFVDEEFVEKSAITAKKPKQMIVYVTFFCVYLKCATLIKYLKNASRLMLWNPFLFSIIIVCFCFATIVAVSYFYVILYNALYREVKHTRSFEGYMIKSFEIILTFMVEFIYSPFEKVHWEALVKIPTVVLTFFFTVFLTAYLIKYMRVRMRAKERFFNLEMRLRSFARKSQLPPSLRQKILLYFQVFLQNKYFKEDEIFDYIPDTFKAEILSHHCIPLLKSFYAFENLPMYVLSQLAESLKYQLYLPNEVVMSRNEPKIYMYFVQKGTVALYSHDNYELYHFEDGNSINGKSFIEGEHQRTRYAISIEITEIYRLSYDDFMKVMAAYPVLLENMKKDFLQKERVYHDVID